MQLLRSEQIKIFAQVIFLGMLAAFVQVPTDIYLASLPTIQAVMHTTAFHAQFTLIGFFFIYAFAQLLWGPVSDAIGRKHALYCILSIYLAGSLLCVFADSIDGLIFGRLLQAAGGGGGASIGFAILLDWYKGANITKLVARVAGVMLMVPVIALIIGGYLLVHFNWRANFVFLSGYAILLLFITLFLRESLPRHKRLIFRPLSLLHQYRLQATHRAYIIPMLAASFVFSGFFAYLSSSAFIYQRFYRLSPTHYSYLFALNALAFVSATIILGRLNHKKGTAVFVRRILLGLLIFLILAAILIGIWPHYIVMFLVPLLVVSFCMGFIEPSLHGLGLENVVQYAGVASGLFGFMRIIVANIIALAVIHSINSGFRLILMIGVCFIVALGVFYFNPRGAAKKISTQ